MSMELRTIGSCGVDSGQLFITDPCYVKYAEHGNGQWNMEWKEGKDGRREYTTLPDPTLEVKRISILKSVKQTVKASGELKWNLVSLSGLHTETESMQFKESLTRTEQCSESLWI